jgi:hypothetical protein
VEPTHVYTGTACLGTVENITTTASGRDFDQEKVIYLATKLYNIYFVGADNKVWITDADRWKENSKEIKDEDSDNK